MRPGSLTGGDDQAQRGRRLRTVTSLGEVTDVDGNGGASWRTVEIAKLLASYFGEKLGLPRSAHIPPEITNALVGRDGEAEPVKSEPADAQTTSPAQTPTDGVDRDG